MPEISSHFNKIRQNDGIALLTVILVIAILMILAAVAIESTGSDVINAGKYMNISQTVDYSNSAMKLVLMQLGSNTDTNAGVGTPLPNLYYYTTSGSNSIQTSNSYIVLSVSNINSYFSGYLNFPYNNGAFGFEYFGTYGNEPGYSLKYKFYNGEINAISYVQSNSGTVETGMTFSYGPLQESGYNQ